MNPKKLAEILLKLIKERVLISIALKVAVGSCLKKAKV
jgi:hypothetical protein